MLTLTQTEQIATEYKILARKYHPDKVEGIEKSAGKRLCVYSAKIWFSLWLTCTDTYTVHLIVLGSLQGTMNIIGLIMFVLSWREPSTMRCSV